MLRDLRDAWGWIERLVRRIERLESGAMLENSSITEGRLRLIGGLLLLDSGATLQVIGTLNGDGSFNWTGTETHKGNETHEGAITNTGTLTNNGQTRLNGPVTVAGDVTSTGKFSNSGDFTNTGKTYLNGPTDVNGDLKVSKTLDVTATSRFRNTVKVLSPGRLEVGSMILDPASHNGYIKMPNGAEVLGYDSNLELYSAGSGAAKNGLKVVPTGIVIANMPSPPAGVALRWLGWDPMSGRVYAVTGGTGGPLGSWAWPFPLSSVTSEFGPRSGRFHEGIDEGNAPAVSGASIRSIGS